MKQNNLGKAVINDFDIGYPDYQYLFEPIDTDFVYPVDPLEITIDKGLPSQNNYYTGKIVDEFGEPLPYATLNSKENNTIWTETDENGNYSISLPSTDSIVIRMLGYETKTIKASELTSEVVLNMDSANQLDEVVIVGTTPTKPVTTTTQTPKNYTPLFITIGALSIIAGAIYVSKPSKKPALAGARKTRKRKPKKKTNNSLNAGVVEIEI